MRINLGVILGYAAVILPVLVAAWAMQVPGRVLVALATIALVSAAAGSVWVARHVRRPVQELKQAAQQVAAGEFQTIRLSDETDELAVLATAFNGMVESLRSRDEQLHALNEALARRLRELDALLEVSRAVSRSLDVQEVLRAILDETVRTFPTARKGLIHLLDPSGTRLIPIAHSRAGGGAVPSAGLPADQGIAGRAVRERRAITVADTATDPDFLDLGSEVRSLMVAPLEMGDTVLGALSLDSAQPHAFTPDMEAVFRALADRAAIALENARLYAESQRRVAELTALYRENARLIGALQAKSGALEEANQALSRASQLKSEFLANMSHELRTPLNAILGFSEILIDQSFGPVNERQARYLGNINASGRHLLDLINDILDLSKIEAGRMELLAEPFRLDTALDEVYTVIEPLAARKRLAVTIQAALEPPRIVADRLRFKQVLYNLLANAVKFTPDGGTIAVRAEWEGAQLVVTVQDSGIGIPADELQNIFDVFHRLERPFQRETEGTGLGLALVLRFMELHGGAVRVESAIGEGSTFTLVLPQPLAMEPAPMVQPETDLALAGQP